MVKFFRDNKSLSITLGIILLVVGVAYSAPLKVAYTVSLSKDINGILVKNETRTFLDTIPEFIASKIKVPASLTGEVYQKQAMLNSYGAALRITGAKTEEGVIFLESDRFGKGKIMSTQELISSPKPIYYLADNTKSSSEESYLYLNNLDYPKEMVPSILTMAHGNSSTVALTLYFLEKMLGGEWSTKRKFDITGALGDESGFGNITRIGSAEDKAKINLEDSLLIMPVGNKNNIANPPANTYYPYNLKELIAHICKLKDRGSLCLNPKIVKYINN